MMVCRSKFVIEVNFAILQRGHNSFRITKSVFYNCVLLFSFFYSPNYSRRNSFFLCCFLLFLQSKFHKIPCGVEWRKMRVKTKLKTTTGLVCSWCWFSVSPQFFTIWIINICTIVRPAPKCLRSLCSRKRMTWYTNSAKCLINDSQHTTLSTRNGWHWFCVQRRKWTHFVAN